MSDRLDLAGVIGTWVAVFLALAALLGLLPAYLLYKRSRSENAAAIAAIHDPRHTFVSGFGMFGVVLTQKFKIPDLRKAPQWSALENATLDKIPGERLLGPIKSRTAWVEFSQLITAMFPGVELGGKRLLSFEHGEARLAVHKTWILALGILHRYSLRMDHGLPLGAAMEVAANGALLQEARLSGLSGYLDYRDFPSSVDQNVRQYVISFEMHHLATIRESLKKDHLSFRTLALLFRGFVVRDQGTLLRGRVASRQYTTDWARVRRVIARVKTKELRENFVQILPGINIQAQTELSFEIDTLPMEIEKDRQPGEAAESSLRRHGLYKFGDWYGLGNRVGIWIFKKDAHLFVLGYLEQKPSPYGFLFDVRPDLVVKRLLKTSTAGTILDLATQWLARLPEEFFMDNLKEKLRKGLDQMSHNDLLAVQWSRRAMQAIASLDEVLGAISEQERVKSDNAETLWKSIRAMYACDKDFQQSLGKYLNGLQPDIGDGSQARVSFDIEGGTISVPEGEGAEFPFDFKHLFPETMINQNTPGGTTSITPAIAIFACLQGQLRATAWKISLSPAHLGVLDGKIREICYVSTDTFHLSLPRSSESWNTWDGSDSSGARDSESLTHSTQNSDNVVTTDEDTSELVETENSTSG